MINRIKLPLEQKEYSALLKLALEELRDPESQARHIVREELTRRGLLASDQKGLELMRTKGIHDDC